MADTLTSKGLTILDPTLFYDVTKFNNNFNLINNLLGTIICTSTTRPSTSLYDGMQLWETDTQRFVTRVAGAWVPAPTRIIVANSTARDAIVTKYDGMEVYRQDRDWTEVYDGAAWRVVGVAHCSSVADRDTSTVITSPYNGQIATTTDTGTVWLRQAGGWVQVGVKSVLTVTNTTQVTGIGATEVITDQGSFTALTNHRYEITAEFGAFGSNSADQIAMTLRYAAAGAVTNAGTLLRSRLEGFKGTSVRENFEISVETTALPGGTVAVGLGVARGSGAGTITRDGASNNASLLRVKCLGY